MNVLARLVLQPLDRTPTDREANALRHTMDMALHRGEVLELIAG